MCTLFTEYVYRLLVFVVTIYCVETTGIFLEIFYLLQRLSLFELEINRVYYTITSDDSVQKVSHNPEVINTENIVYFPLQKIC